MLRRHYKKCENAQIFLEYTMVIGAIIMIMFAMSTMVKRGTQGMIKVVADQIGDQDNADQRFDRRGHLVSSYTATRTDTDKTKDEFARVMTYSYNDIASATTRTIANLGFVNEN